MTKKLIKIVFLLLPVLTYNISFSQATNLEYNDIYNNSSNYIFLGLVYKPYQPTYTPDYNSMRSALQQRQARYDYNLDIISNEIQKVRSLKLINLHNISTLTNFQIQLNSEIEKPTSFASWDYSLTENLNRALSYVTSIYNITDIRNELRLLNDLKGFDNYIQNSDPYQVNRGILYDDLSDFIEALKGYNSNELSMSFKDLMDRLRENKFNYSKQNILYKYNSVTKYKTVLNGWHEVYFVDNKYKQTGKRSVYVQNGKVILFKRYNGNEEKITSGGIIYNQHCNSISYNYLAPNGVFSNTDFEIFFLD